jgi:succinate dehydrogenase / fumarate reductase iron-sulfur subunit
MAKDSDRLKTVHVFRFDPESGGPGHYDRFEVRVADENLTTVLDVLLSIQKEQDPSLAFRYACRVSMCGSCGMVINGIERLACKTVVSELKEKEITIRPLNHFPVIKDLAVDMDPFFEKYKESMPFFDPAHETDEPAVIRPDSRERVDIGLSTECIACGCCVSSCSMVHHHDDYVGPASLNRAFSLLADTRDGLHQERLDRVLGSCFNCRTEFNCTEVCPKEISPTRAIKYIQSRACLESFRRKGDSPAPDVDAVAEPLPEDLPTDHMDRSRRRFLKRVTYAVGAASAAVVGGVLITSTIAPALRKPTRQWVNAGKLSDLDLNTITTINLHYRIRDGFYESRKVMPVMITRLPDEDKPVVFSSRCTHLGCTVRWDRDKQLFLCACHGGAFSRDGSVKAGPPPRPLDRCAVEVRKDDVFVEVV